MSLKCTLEVHKGMCLFVECNDGFKHVSICFCTVLDGCWHVQVCFCRVQDSSGHVNVCFSRVQEQWTCECVFLQGVAQQLAWKYASAECRTALGLECVYM